MEFYPITDRAEFDKKYAIIEGEDHEILNKLLQEARYVNGGGYWVKPVAKEMKIRDKKFPWRKKTYTDYEYVFYSVMHNGDGGEENICGYVWDYEKLKWFFIGLSGGYGTAKGVNLVYNKETNKVEEVPFKK